MNYRDVKEYLKGYTEYLSIVYGMDFRLEWRKKYREFVIKAKNLDPSRIVNGYSDVYLDLIVLNVADLGNNICNAEVRGFYYISDYQNVYNILKENDFNLRKIPPFILNIEIRSKDRLQNFLELLGDAEFFSEGWVRK